VCMKRRRVRCGKRDTKFDVDRFRSAQMLELLCTMTACVCENQILYSQHNAFTFFMGKYRFEYISKHRVSLSMNERQTTYTIERKRDDGDSTTRVRERNPRVTWKPWKQT